MARRYWLLKSEPTAFSFDDLAQAPNGTTHWDGVRNFQARNLLRDELRKGDRVFIYHSNCTPPAIVGIAEVVRNGYPDFTAWDPEDKHYDPKSDPDNPTWYMVDIRYVRPLKRALSLDELRATPGLEEMVLLRKGSRLSVQPVTADEWKRILALEKQHAG